MENRKELSEKSKQLIAKQFKSDILNVSTGYYKKENIFPITPKPTESKEKYKEFIPKYKEIKPYEMHFNNLLSDQQKHNHVLMNNLKIIQASKNPEVEIKRKRDKIIKDNCYDKRGNFSAKKRYFLEFYGLENIKKNIYNRLNSKSIKEKRKENKSFMSTSIIFNNDNLTIYTSTDNYSTINYKENSDNDHINDNDNDDNNSISDEFFNNDIMIKRLHNKTTRNKNNNKNIFHNLSSFSNKDLGNSFNYKISNGNNYNKIKTDNNLTNKDISKTIDKTENENRKNKNKKSENKFYHPKGIDKVFYTQRDKPVKSNRIYKKEKPDENSDYYDIEIKIEAKIRKNKKDEDFDRNYRKASKELQKLNIAIDKRKILTEKGFENKVVRKKRKGTPGKILYKNQQNKDENTRLNTGFGFKRDKNIMPQKNQNYKNDYSYRLSYFNHNKK